MAASPAEAQLEVTLSNYTLHFEPSPDHRRVNVIGVQELQPSGSIRGGAVFSNSFGQPSAYGFIGQRYGEPMGWRNTYVEWTAGIMYGYVGDHKHDVPMNVLGFAPALVPTFGYQIDRFAALQVSMLGFAALMVRLTFTLP